MLKHIAFAPPALLLLHLFIHSLSTPIDCASVPPELSVNLKQLQVIAGNMDLFEDPCDNYYAHACGNWRRQHKGEQYNEAISQVDHIVNKNLIDYFQSYQLQGSGHNGNLTFTDKLWLYYDSCRNTDELQLQRYLELVRPNANLDWKLMQEIHQPNTTWPANRFNWLFTLARLRGYSFSGTLIDHRVVPMNSTAYVIYLSKPLPVGKNQLPAKHTIAALLIKIGIPNSRAIFVAKQLVEFESHLQILRQIEDAPNLAELTLRDLQKFMPQIPWRFYVQLILRAEVDLEFTLRIENWDYFVALSEFLKLTKPSLICNYIMFKFLYFLLKDRTSSHSKFDCMWDLRTKMDLAVKFLYKQQFFGDDLAAEYAADIERLLTQTKREFAARLEANVLQLQPVQVEYLKRKLDAVNFNIGNLPANANEQYVAAYYASVHMREGEYNKDYHKNHLQLLQLRARKEHAQLTAPPPTAAAYFHIGDSELARSSSAFYIFRLNLIVIPYAILQPPIYDIHMHDILKMSQLGFVLSHELIHGFDTNSLAIDHEGNDREIGKSIMSNTQFESSMQCLQQPETVSINERIADFVGLRLVFDALFGANSTKNAPQPSFTDIPAKRLFFLNFAQFFCGSMSSTFAGHDADDVRLQQALANFQPFIEEYQCAQRDAMNPDRKCQLY